MREFLKYCLVGGSGTVIDMGALFLLIEFGGVYILIAACISFILGVINNFTWNKLWTFKNKSKNYSKQFVKFFIVSMGGLLLTLAFLYLFVTMMGIWYMFAKILTTGVILVWNFSWNKFWTFRVREEALFRMEG